MSDESQQSGVRIRDYEPRDRESFRQLNEEWLTRYFRVEPKDRQLFADPEGRILIPGGAILMLDLDDEPAGCCALIRKDAETLEVAKMAVTATQQGKGFGKLLLRACIERAQSLGARRLYLESNRTLAPALALYRTFGFVERPPEAAPSSDYVRVDIFMEREL